MNASSGSLDCLYKRSSSRFFGNHRIDIRAEARAKARQQYAMAWMVDGEALLEKKKTDRCSPAARQLSDSQGEYSRFFNTKTVV